jgi:urease accessory protein
MLTCTKLLPAGRGLAPALLKRAATVELRWAQRKLSRFDATDSQGRALGIALPAGSVLRGGDVLVADDGSLLRVLAAAEPLLQVTPCAEHGTAADLLRAAYRLGGRHVEAELRPEGLLVAADAAVAEWLSAMHLDVAETQGPFEPDHAGAASADHGHAHHPPAPARGKPVGIAVAAAPAAHVHGPGCGHDHHH